MFKSINDEYNAKRMFAKSESALIESALDDDMIMDDDEDDDVDVDSVPDDMYKKVDAALDKVISDPTYDDEEIEEMVDGDEDDVSEIDAIVDEAVNAWYDDENIHHPNVDRRDNVNHQPKFHGLGQKTL